MTLARRGDVDAGRGGYLIGELIQRQLGVRTFSPMNSTSKIGR